MGTAAGAEPRGEPGRARKLPRTDFLDARAAREGYDLQLGRASVLEAARAHLAVLPSRVLSGETRCPAPEEVEAGFPRSARGAGALPRTSVARGRPRPCAHRQPNTLGAPKPG